MIAFTDVEKALIVSLSVPGGWDTDEAAPLKRKIKKYFMRHAARCCYCLRSMHGWHGLTIDVEHVLPKAQFPQYTFTMENLNIACKRCNMGIKGTDTSFYGGSACEPQPFRSELYTFVHPNCDASFEHLSILVIQANDKLLVKYGFVHASSKAQNTYTYFRLQEIETNSFDEAQGLVSATPDISLPHSTAEMLRTILPLSE